jgi:hypothetical protein
MNLFGFVDKPKNKNNISNTNKSNTTQNSHLNNNEHLSNETHNNRHLNNKNDKNNKSTILKSPSNSNTFMMGIGNGNFNSNSLIFHLKNIETEINQQLVGKSSVKLNNSKNTFNTIISKLRKEIEDLNLKILNFNKEKKEIHNMHQKDVMKLKKIITSIYGIVKILTKTFDLSDEQKINLLEKIRTTIENSPGFLKSINSITVNVNKLMKQNTTQNIGNTKMNSLLSDVNINKIASNIGESKEQIHNSTPINLNYQKYNIEQKLPNSHTELLSNNSHAELLSNNSHTELLSNNSHTELLHNNQENKRNKSISNMNNYYKNLKESHNGNKNINYRENKQFSEVQMDLSEHGEDKQHTRINKSKNLTILQNRIKREKINLNIAKQRLKEYVNE